MRRLAGLLIIGLAKPAQADDWHGFKWGMTEAEVEAAASDIAVTRLETVKQRKTYPAYAPFQGTWTDEGQTYRLTFYFDIDRRLRDIEIEPEGIACRDRNDAFAVRFGKFDEETAPLGSSTRISRWWRLGEGAELMTLVLHLPGSDTWNCSAKIKPPVGR